MRSGQRIALISLALAAVAGLALLAFVLLKQDLVVPDDPSPTSVASPAVAGTAESNAASANEPSAIAGEAETAEREALGAEPVAAPDEGPKLEIELRDYSDQPIRRARMAVLRDGVLLADARTGDEGIASVTESTGVGTVIVRPRGRTPWIEAIELSAGRRLIKLPRGVAIAGRVRIDGAAPPESIELKLTSDRPLFDPDKIPADARAALRANGGAALTLESRTREDGSFEFSGLSRPFSGEITLPEEFSFVRASAGVIAKRLDTLRLDEPVEGLVIELAVLPQLVGRLVAPEGNAGVPNVRVDAHLRIRGRKGPVSGRSSGVTDSEGRFAIPFVVTSGRADDPRIDPAALVPIERVDLGFVPPGETVRRASVEAAAMRGRWDVGDVVLQSLGRIDFLVRDTAGAPVEGAVAVLESASEPTNAEGRGAFAYMPASGRRVRVGKLGWREADLELGETPPPLLEVTLSRSNRLELTFVDAQGAPLEQAHVVLTCTLPLFADGGGRRQPATSVETGATRESSGSGSRMEFVTSRDGQIVLGSLQPNTPINLRMSGALGATLFESSLTIGPEEWRAQELRVAEVGQEFAGVVLDEEGLPLADASVRLRPAPADASGQRAGRTNRYSSANEETDLAGRFRFRGLLPGLVSLDISKDGFSPLLIASYELPLGGPPAEFRLSRVMRLTVRVLDETGRAVATDAMRATSLGDKPLGAERKAENVFRFEDLPTSRVTVSATIAALEYSREIDPLSGDTELIVPSHGALRVSIAPRDTQVPSNARVVVNPKDRGRRQLRSRVDWRESEPSVEFRALLPGIYSVSIEVPPERGAANQRVTRLGAPVSVTIVEHETAQAVLVP